MNSVAARSKAGDVRRYRRRSLAVWRATAAVVAVLITVGTSASCQAQSDTPTRPQRWTSPSGQQFEFGPLSRPSVVSLPSSPPRATRPVAVTPISGPQAQDDQSTTAIPLAITRPPTGDDDLLLPADDLLSGHDDLLPGNDDLLGAPPAVQPPGASVLDAMGPQTHANSGNPPSLIPGAGHGSDQALRTGLAAGEDPHAALYEMNCYPSATQCATCHRKIYDEWRVSAHAYAAVSPMFHKFEQAITQLSQGTIGTFCVRCHAPVAVQAGFPRKASIVDAPYVFREGVTCIACHRVKEAYGKVNGERRIEPGDIYAPVYGSIGGEGVAKVIADQDHFKVKTDPGDQLPGQPIHAQGIQFEQLSQSGFCASCHQVAVHPGIALEVVWAQYRAGPACRKGVSCQDCHMGLVPGKPMGYSYGAAAEVNGKTVSTDRKHANHMFYGPGNPIAHPGIFPHNEKAYRWTIDQWLAFDWRAGWGTEDFEQAVVRGQATIAFPADWKSTDERRDARKILDENLKLLDIKRASSVAVMEAGSKIDGPFFEANARRGQDLDFHYIVRNISEGHNMPSGSLGAQPQLWLNVVLTGPDGRRLWESGYLDSNGDLANQHSLEVAQGRIPVDQQLFNLQTQFLTTGVKGTDREMYLPINVDIDQIPFLRPGAQPISVLNHPPFIRMEAHSIPPLDHRRAHYRVPGALLCQPGPYRLSVRLRSRMEPIYFMKFCQATPEMERRMLEQTLDIHPYSVEFTIP